MSLATPLMTGFIGMNKRGRLDLLFDGLMSGRQHGTDPPLCFADGPATEAQAKVLLQLMLYLADALMELTTLQRDGSYGDFWRTEG